MKDKYQSENQSKFLKHNKTLSGHVNYVYRMSLSPDGKLLASSSADRRVRLWNIETGELLASFEHPYPVLCASWSSDGSTIATGVGGFNSNIFLWDVVNKRKIFEFDGHVSKIRDLEWLSSDSVLASCSDDGTIRLWDVKSRKNIGILSGHIMGVTDIALSKDQKYILSGSYDKSVRIWEVKSRKQIYNFNKHSAEVTCVAWSQNGKYIASGAKDRTIRLWSLSTNNEIRVLEGHTSEIISINFLKNDELFASQDVSGSIVIWDTKTWGAIAHLNKLGNVEELCNFVCHPSLPLIITRGTYTNEINIWSIDFDGLLNAEKSLSTVHYVSAKIVLLGESGVGKSALGIRIAEKQFRPTESTHAAQFWHLSINQKNDFPINLKAEINLWDLAGQPEYRLVHQLFLDDTDGALLLFDCSDSNDPFRGVQYWAKVLRKHAPSHAIKLLVSSRCDVSPVTVDRVQINQVLAQYNLHEYFKTSAKLDNGIDNLIQTLISNIPWLRLPSTSMRREFEVVRDFLLEIKSEGITLITFGDIQKNISKKKNKLKIEYDDIDTAVKHLQSRGIVYKLSTKPENTFVLTRPELINQYASSVIQAARSHPLGIGAVIERDVLVADIPLAGFERVSPYEESLLLEATIEMLLQHDLCFREMGMLVFPSQINISKPLPPLSHPRNEVTYKFSGSIETIYASLVVRLSYTDYFQREDQWKHAVEFSIKGKRLGFEMRQIEEGTGQLEIYFDSAIIEFDRVTFIRFITDHLKIKGVDIQEEIRLYCPVCGKEVEDRKAIVERVKRRFLDIPCQYCTATIIIPQSIEEKYQRDRKLMEKQELLIKTVEDRSKVEVEQFMNDQQHYMQSGNRLIHILHLSDIHLMDKSQALIYRTQLESDLIQELDVKRLEYLVISGDIANTATEDEYKAAFNMIDNLVKRFGLDTDRVIVVPGNHDVNWDASERGYKFVPKRKLPSTLPDGKYIFAGDAGALLRDDLVYGERFNNFSSHFYKKIYGGREFSSSYVEQIAITKRPDDRILFLSLNSAWELDHYYKGRASINMEVLSQALDQLQDDAYKNWLKLAVWHHPVTGEEMMNDDFVQLLAVHGFQICMHGHIHKAINGLYKYDEKRDIRIIGAGTFGAPAKQQVTGIPLQYNLLTFDPIIGKVTVNSRAKIEPNGAWFADARWIDKKNPKPEYSFEVKGYVDGK